MFEDPGALWKACIRYFEWNEENPIHGRRAIVVSNTLVYTKEKHPRAMSVQAMCIFLGITSKSWYEWRNTRTDLLPVMRQAEEVIRTQKFERGMIGQFNAMLVARDLGLADRNEMSGPDGGPIQHEHELDAERFTSKIAGLVARKAKKG